MCVFVCSSRVVPCTSWLGVRCGAVCLGLGCCHAPPLLAGVLGRVCVCVGAPLVPRHSWLGCAVWACLLGSGFGCVPPLLVGLLGCVCVRACVPRAPSPSWAAACGEGVCGCCPPPSPLVFVFFGGGGAVACRVVALWCRPLAVPVLGLVVSVPPSRLVRAAPSCVFCISFFFFAPAWCVSACSGCPFFRWAAAPGFVLPVFGWVALRCPFGGSRPRCRLAGGFGRLLWRGWAVSWVWAFLVPPPPCFFLFFWGGGGLLVPPSAFPRLVHALVGIRCGLPSCCWCWGFARPCPGPMGRLGYVHFGLGGPSCWVRFWLCRLGSCARRLREALG